MMYDVAIVGFGPTGAVLAGLLGQQGLKVWVCDQATEVYEKPRAIALDHEIMRVFQQLGLLEALTSFVEPFTNSEFYGVDGQLIKCMSTVEPPYPMTFTPSMVFSQPNFERVLRQRVQNLPSVQVNLGTRLLGLQPINEGGSEAGVTLTVAPTDGAEHHGQMGALHQVQARYVVGCDGASSLVRQSVGIELEDLDFDEPWLVVDVLVNEQGLAKLPKVSVQYCEPDRPSTYLIVTQNHRRWELSINPGEDPKQLATPEGTWKLLSRWLQPHEGTLWRQASYRFHALVAERFHSGRVFLAGDAAHQQPPFLGQGMCQGVRDAVNLSWKLGAVLNGHASNALLDSYSQERKAHVKELTSRIKGIGQLVGERNLDKARERDRKLLAECGGVVKPMPRQNVQPALVHGCLDPAASAGTGTLFPQAWLKQVRMDDLWGCGWRVVLSAEASADFATWLAQPAYSWIKTMKLGAVDAIEADGVMAAWLQAHSCHAALVRPDHYVFGTAQTATQLHGQLEHLGRYVVQLDQSKETQHAT